MVISRLLGALVSTRVGVALGRGSCLIMILGRGSSESLLVVDRSLVASGARMILHLTLRILVYLVIYEDDESIT